MNIKTQLLIGSLSNDLFRVATLTQRGSSRAAHRFLLEAKRWSQELQNHDVAGYIVRLSIDISGSDTSDISLSDAEKYLMYGVLLQNYILHQKVKAQTFV